MFLFSCNGIAVAAAIVFVDIRIFGTAVVVFVDIRIFGTAVVVFVDIRIFGTAVVVFAVTFEALVVVLFD